MGEYVTVIVPVGASCSDCQVPLTTLSNMICSVYDIFFLDELCGKEVGGRFYPGSWCELADLSTLCATLLSSVLHCSGLVYKLLCFRVWKKTFQL